MSDFKDKMHQIQFRMGKGVDLRIIGGDIKEDWGTEVPQRPGRGLGPK